MNLAPLVSLALSVSNPQVSLVQTDSSNWSIQYPPTINPNNYSWTSLWTTNLTDWTEWPVTNNELEFPKLPNVFCYIKGTFIQ